MLKEMVFLCQLSIYIKKKLLIAFGLVDRFISFIKLCYIDVSSFNNINGSVCGHVTLSSGIKQGDSISLPLYIM